MHKHFMQIAIDLATKNVLSHAGGPFGAIIVKNDTIIAEGVNMVTSTMDPTAHAEIIALRIACKKLNTVHLTGCTLYTSCEPCPMCLAATYWAHIKEIYCANSRTDAASIGFDDALIYKEIALIPEKRSVALHFVKNTTAKEAFELWSKSNQKITY